MANKKTVGKSAPAKRRDRKRSPDRVISIAALTISIAAFLYSTVWDLADRKEVLSIIHDKAYFTYPLKYERASITESMSLQRVAFVTEAFSFTLSNNSVRRMGIVGINVHEEYDASAHKENLLQPPMEDFDIVHSIEKAILINGERRSLPITIDSNESISLTVILGIRINRKVNEILQSKYAYGQDGISYVDIRRMLFKAGSDIWGNSVRNLFLHSYSPDENARFPIFKLKVASAKGSVFVRPFSELTGINDMDMIEKYELTD